jgi:hypothetical protein
LSTISTSIKSADWVIDLGPEGGSGGGHVVATGTPDQIAANEHSDGKFLATVLKPHHPGYNNLRSPEMRKRYKIVTTVLFIALCSYSIAQSKRKSS